MNSMLKNSILFILTLFAFNAFAMQQEDVQSERENQEERIIKILNSKFPVRFAIREKGKEEFIFDEIFATNEIKYLKADLIEDKNIELCIAYNDGIIFNHFENPDSWDEASHSFVRANTLELIQKDHWIIYAGAGTYGPTKVYADIHGRINAIEEQFRMHQEELRQKKESQSWLSKNKGKVATATIGGLGALVAGWMYYKKSVEQESNNRRAQAE